MEAERIDPDRKYTSRDMLTAGFGIAMGGLVFAGVAYAFAIKQDIQDIHAAWFFGVTSLFIFVMGAGTFVYGLKKGDQGKSNSSNPNPSASSNPSESVNTTA